MPRVLIGLGNPGSRYHATRHNVGWMTIERVGSIAGIRVRHPPLKRFEIGRGTVCGSPLYLVKPLTFMNRTGDMLSSLLKYSGADIQDLVVVCDTLDLPPGVCRLRLRGSSAGQKGLQSLIDRAGTNEIARLFIGIGRPEHRDAVVSYVLERPRGAEREAIEDGVERAARALLRLVDEDPEKVMNELNQVRSSASGQG